MPSYKYELRDAGGQVTAGVIEAQSLMDATSRLRSQGGYVLDVSPLTAGAAGILEKLRSVNFEMGPGLKDVMNFTNQLAVMIKAGINIRSAIEGVCNQVENVKFRKTLEQIKSDVADMKNIGGRDAGTITAACLLAEFVGECNWAHLDIAGTASRDSDRDYLRKGGTGFGVRLLTE